MANGFGFGNEISEDLLSSYVEKKRRGLPVTAEEQAAVTAIASRMGAGGGGAAQTPAQPQGGVDLLSLLGRGETQQPASGFAEQASRAIFGGGAELSPEEKSAIVAQFDARKFGKLAPLLALSAAREQTKKKGEMLTLRADLIKDHRATMAKATTEADKIQALGELGIGLELIGDKQGAARVYQIVDRNTAIAKFRQSEAESLSQQRLAGAKAGELEAEATALAAGKPRKGEQGTIIKVKTASGGIKTVSLLPDEEFTPQPGETIIMGQQPGPSVLDLIGKFESSQVVKDRQEIGTRVRIIEEAFKESKTAENLIAVDQALVTAYNKILDPTSVVRESEYARTRDDQSVLRRFKGSMSRISEGGAGLTESDRKALVKMAQRASKAAEEKYQKRKKQFEKIAAQSGIDPSLIFEAEEGGPARFAVSEEELTPEESPLLKGPSLPAAVAAPSSEGLIKRFRPKRKK